MRRRKAVLCFGHGLSSKGLMYWKLGPQCGNVESQGLKEGNKVMGAPSSDKINASRVGLN